MLAVCTSLGPGPLIISHPCSRQRVVGGVALPATPLRRAAAGVAPRRACTAAAALKSPAAAARDRGTLQIAAAAHGQQQAAPLNAAPVVQGILDSLQLYLRRFSGLWQKFLPMLSLFFCLSFINTILDSLKDTLVITAVGGGAHVIPYLTVYAVLPISFMFLLAYSYASHHLSRAALFNGIITCFMVFFGVFTFVLYPNADLLHPHALADSLSEWLPAGLAGGIGMLRNWTFTLFFCMSELWGDVCMGLLFWGLANDTTSLLEAPTLYPLFGLGANLAQALAGMVLKATTHSSFSSSQAFGSCLNLSMAIVAAMAVAVVLIHSRISKDAAAAAAATEERARQSLQPAAPSGQTSASAAQQAAESIAAPPPPPAAAGAPGSCSTGGAAAAAAVEQASPSISSSTGGIHLAADSSSSSSSSSHTNSTSSSSSSSRANWDRATSPTLEGRQHQLGARRPPTPFNKSSSSKHSAGSSSSGGTSAVVRCSSSLDSLIAAAPAAAAVQTTQPEQQQQQQQQQEGGEPPATPGKPKLAASLRESFRVLAGSVEIRCLAVMSLAQGLTTNLMEFAWKSHMRLLYPSPQEFTAFLGDVATWTGVVTGVLMLATPLLFDRLGWRGVASASPQILLWGGCVFFAAAILYQHLFGAAVATAGAAAGGAAGALLLQGLVMAGALLYVFSKGAKFSLFKPAEEMVYITLDEEGRTRGKAAIDVVGAQTGKSGGSLLQQVLLLLSGGSMVGILPVMFGVFFMMLRGWLQSVRDLSSVKYYTYHSIDEDELGGDLSGRNFEQAAYQQQQQQQAVAEQGMASSSSSHRTLTGDPAEWGPSASSSGSGGSNGANGAINSRQQQDLYDAPSSGSGSGDNSVAGPVDNRQQPQQQQVLYDNPSGELVSQPPHIPPQQQQQPESLGNGTTVALAANGAVKSVATAAAGERGAGGSGSMSAVGAAARDAILRPQAMHWSLQLKELFPCEGSE